MEYKNKITHEQGGRNSHDKKEHDLTPSLKMTVGQGSIMEKLPA